MINIEKKINDNIVKFMVSGRLDTSTSPDFEKEINEVKDTVDGAIIDFADLEYISSAGLRVLLIAKKYFEGKSGIKVVNANDTIKEIFDITGFTNILTIE